MVRDFGKCIKILFVFLFVLIIVSCKKEKVQEQVENSGYKSVPKGNLLVLEVGEDVNYGYEYKYQNGQIPLDSMPVWMSLTTYIDSLNSYMYWIGFDNLAVTWGYVAYPYGGYCRKFPDFYAAALDNFMPGNYTFIPKEQLIHNSSKATLKEENANVLFEREMGSPGWDKNACWKPVWEKVSDLAVVIQYRNMYPNADVGFIMLEDEQGVVKNYVFLAKED